MKNKRTYYHLLLDRSGSMNNCIEQTIEGLNQQIRLIKEVAGRFPEQELFTSLTLFNNQVSPVWFRLPPYRLRELGYSDYRPEGTTALLDAIGFSIDDLLKTTENDKESDEASIVMVIITDGYENASVQYTFQEISTKIKELELTGKWTFSYLGATLDAVEIAGRLNIQKHNAMHFKVELSYQVFESVNKSIERYLDKKQSGETGNDFLVKD